MLHTLQLVESLQQDKGIRSHKHYQTQPMLWWYFCTLHFSCTAVHSPVQLTAKDDVKTESDQFCFWSHKVGLTMSNV